MDQNDRGRIQAGWQDGTFHVICATIAFVVSYCAFDFPARADPPFFSQVRNGNRQGQRSIRYSLLAFSESRSLLPGKESSFFRPTPFSGLISFLFNQETGRAGRDGKTSICILYFSYGDTKLIYRLIDDGEGTQAQKESNRANVRLVVQYCMNNTDCRRAQVLQYFGENFNKKDCHKTCDNCMGLDTFEQKDVSSFAKDAIRLVQSIEQDKGVTMLHAVDVFRGSKGQKVSFPSSNISNRGHR